MFNKILQLHKEFQLEISSIFGFFGIFIYTISITFPITLSIPLTILCICGIIVGICNNNKQFKLTTPTVICIFLFIISLFISYSVSKDKILSFQLSLVLFPALLLYFLIIENSNIKNIFWLYILLTIVIFNISFTYIITSLYSVDSDPGLWIKKISNPSFLVPNDLIILPILLPFTIVLFIKTNQFSLKILSIVTILSSIIAICLYQSRLGMLLLIICNIIAGIMLFRKSSIYGITITILLFLLVDWFQDFAIISKCSTIGWKSRLPVWITAFTMFVDSPIIGHGPRTFGIHYFEYLNKTNLPSWFIIDKRFTPWAHNLYLEILAEQGLIGFTIISILLIYTFILSVKLIKSDNYNLYLLSIAPFISLVLILVGGFFELSFIRHWFVIIFFILLAIINSLTNTKKCLNKF